MSDYTSSHVRVSHLYDELLFFYTVRVKENGGSERLLPTVKRAYSRLPGMNRGSE